MRESLEKLAFQFAPGLTARRYIRSHAWALTPEAMAMMLDIAEARVDGIRFTAEERETRIAAAGGRRAQAPGGSQSDDKPAASKFAVIEMRGVLARHADEMMEYSGGTSTSKFAQLVRAAGADANVRGVLIFADTEGGSVDGCKEASDAVAEVVAGGTPVVVYAENILASGGCWIGFQATEVYAAPFTLVGSLGVRMGHRDVSESDKAEGLKYTYITFPVGGNKAEGNPHEPLAADTVKHYEDLIRPAGEAFYAAVASGRKVPVSQVYKWGQGRVFDASEAERLGMIDGITTFGGALARLETLSGATAAAGQEEHQMTSEEIAGLVRKAIADELPGALATALVPLEGRVAALDTGQKALAATNVTLEAKIDANGKEALKDRVAAFVEARTDAGQIPVGEKDAEVAELLALTPELREARMARLSARSGKVPTKARIEDSTASAPAAPVGVFAGMNAIPGEAEAAAQCKAEGLDPAVDMAAWSDRMQQLKAEGEADA